jgi:hypothetical protein
VAVAVGLQLQEQPAAVAVEVGPAADLVRQERRGKEIAAAMERLEVTLVLEAAAAAQDRPAAIQLITAIPQAAEAELVAAFLGLLSPTLLAVMGLARPPMEPLLPTQATAVTAATMEAMRAALGL